VDESLRIIGGRQLMNVTADDVPVLARVLVMLVLGVGSAASYQIGQLAVVHLTGPDVDLHVRAEDWLKIAPYLADGTFNVIAEAEDLFPPENATAAVIETQYPSLYRRVYGVLSTLFTVKFPTTNF
jgi:hypothetical protein